MKPEWEKIYEPFLGARKLNLGCGRNLESGDGWSNADRTPGMADLVFDLEGTPWRQISDSSFDTVLASHVLEHVREIIPVMGEIHRILKPGGHLIAITPYASSDDAWEDPTHVRAFTEKSWYYFNRRLYEQNGCAASYDSPVKFYFSVIQLSLIPYPQFAKDSEIEFKVRHWRNVIREVHAVLRKEP